MFKKLSILLLVLVVFSSTTFAVEQKSNVNEFKVEPGMTSSHPFYFLERASEAVGSTFTFGPIKRANRFIGLAQEKLAEAEELLLEDDDERAKHAIFHSKKLIQRAVQEIQKAKNKDFDVTDLEREIEEVIELQKELLPLPSKEPAVEIVENPDLLQDDHGKPGMEGGSTQVARPEGVGDGVNSKLYLCMVECGARIVEDCIEYSSPHMYNLTNCRGDCIGYQLFYGCSMEAGCDQSCWQTYEANCGASAYNSCIDGCKNAFS